MNARQARVTVVMGVVAALGIAAILWAWWDSTEFCMLWVNSECWIFSAASEIVMGLENSSLYLDLGFNPGFNRDRFTDSPPDLAYLFPGIEMSPGTVELPMWFLLGVFLSVLLLLWLVLMKRLARPRITEGSSHGTGG
jgi:hypothetical protein